jgi:hypothetical protein
MRKKKKVEERQTCNHKRIQEFTWFTTKGYVHRVVTDFTMMEKIIQETFTI